MEKGTFVLKEPTIKKETLIYLVVRYNYKTIKLSTEFKIHPKYWNHTKQCAREIDAPDYDHTKINNKLKRIKTVANEAINELNQENLEFSIANFKLAYQNKLHPRNKPQIQFFEYVENLVKSRKDGSQIHKNKKFSEYTIKGYNTTLNHLREFSVNTNYRIDFSTIDMDFYHEFVKYLNEDDKAANTIGKHIKNIKTFLSQAKDDGINVCDDFKRKDFHTLQEDTTQIFLSESELETLLQVDLQNHPRLDKVRDIFLIAAFTGLRFSDFRRLTKDNIFISKKDKKHYIKIYTQKNDSFVVIPLHRILNQILKKHKYSPPEMMSNQKFNKYLKELGDHVKFHEKVIVKKTIGGKTKEQALHKFSLMTAHTARRSMASNMYLAGVPTISIMKITGHKSERSFLKYIRISEEQNAELLSTHSFFN